MLRPSAPSADHQHDGQCRDAGIDVYDGASGDVEGAALVGIPLVEPGGEGLAELVAVDQDAFSLDVVRGNCTGLPVRCAQVTIGDLITGRVRLFVNDLDRSLDYYQRVMGLVPSGEIHFHGQRCAFLRVNTEHHSLALYPIALRDELGLSPHTTCLSFGVQLANYRQLRDAVAFLRERGVTVRELPPELSPGIDYSALAIDPEGHAIQLYYYMQQVGPDGSRAAGAVRAEGAESIATWPKTASARPDTFMGEPYLGPWG